MSGYEVHIDYWCGSDGSLTAAVFRGTPAGVHIAALMRGEFARVATTVPPPTPAHSTVCEQFYVATSVAEAEVETVGYTPTGRPVQIVDRAGGLLGWRHLGGAVQEWYMADRVEKLRFVTPRGDILFESSQEPCPVPAEVRAFHAAREAARNRIEPFETYVARLGRCADASVPSHKRVAAEFAAALRDNEADGGVDYVGAFGREVLVPSGRLVAAAEAVKAEKRAFSASLPARAGLRAWCDMVPPAPTSEEREA